MFKIEKHPFGPLELLRLTNLETKEKLEIIPQFGGVINGLSLQKNGRMFPVISGCKDFEELISFGKETYWGSKLSPFPNRIAGGKYDFHGESFQLHPNAVHEGNALHGLVYDKEFNVLYESVSEDEAKVTLKYEYRSEVIGYPYDYNLTINYTLNREGFFCSTQIDNVDNRIIPIGDGWHPYFTFGRPIDDLSIKIPSKWLLETENQIPTGKLIENSGFNSSNRIFHHVFDTCYHLDQADPFATVEVYSPLDDIRLIIWQETGKDKYNYVQIYTPPNRDCIAIEPMTCIPNAFNNKIGLIELEQGKKVDFTFGVKLG